MCQKWSVLRQMPACGIEWSVRPGRPLATALIMPPVGWRKSGLAGNDDLQSVATDGGIRK
jgi:hypothetical protein